ncbi:uncharacterized protein LOC142581799 [Dermacentor variabilis]|uniref:uncharacterized protein LOC142581799 n=1 Tax=Dermacentor variabilis TaxID=34621 RepID=UPI003F5B061A
MTMALKVQSVFALWTLSSDLVYVLLFPQFIALFFMPSKINAYGAASGFMIGLMARTLCGEPEFGVPVVLALPLYDAERGQQFPFRTFCMLLSLASLLGCSELAAYLFRSGHLEAHQDVWGCFVEEPSVANLRNGLSTNAAFNNAAGGGVSAMSTRIQTAGIKPRGQQVPDNEGTGEQRKDHSASTKSQRPAAAQHHYGTGARESKRPSNADSKGSGHSVKLADIAAGQKTPSKKSKERKGETAPAKSETAAAKGARAKKHK